MSTTLGQPNISTELSVPPSEKYFRPEVNEEQLDTAVKEIWKKVVNCDDCKLDKSILKAHIDELFFLGKLKELNETVMSGREETNQLVEEIIQYISEIQVKEDKNNKNNKKNYNIDEKLQKIIDKYIQRFTGDRFSGELRRQFNKKLMIPTHSHFMTSMTRATSNIFDSKETEPQIDDLKAIGTLFFDLDGLKMLNDMSLGGYNSGDKALWVMARALTNQDLMNWAGRQGIELVPAHHHGDEFLMGVVAEKDVDLTDNNAEFKGVNGKDVKGISIMKYIGEFVKNKIGEFNEQEHAWDDIKTNNDIAPASIRDIIDFSDPEQMKKFDRVKNSWFAKDPSLKKVFNKNFEYRLSCSYGYSTLEDAVARNIEDKLKFTDDKISYEYIIYMLTGHGLVDTAEKKLKIDKGYGRKKRRSSDYTQDRLLEHLYRTGRERREEYTKQEDYLAKEKELLEFRDEVLELRNKLVENQHEEALTLNEMINILQEKRMTNQNKLKAIKELIRGDNLNHSVYSNPKMSKIKFYKNDGIFKN